MCLAVVWRSDMCTYTHTHIHTPHIHAHTHIYKPHTYTHHTYIHTYTHHTHTHTHTTHRYTHVHTTHTHTHTHIHIHTTPYHTHIHTPHTHTQTTHTHTHRTPHRYTRRSTPVTLHSIHTNQIPCDRPTIQHLIKQIAQSIKNKHLSFMMCLLHVSASTKASSAWSCTDTDTDTLVLYCQHFCQFSLPMSYFKPTHAARIDTMYCICVPLYMVVLMMAL